MDQELFSKVTDNMEWREHEKKNLEQAIIPEMAFPIQEDCNIY